jgi:hypothetical protein
MKVIFWTIVTFIRKHLKKIILTALFILPLMPFMVSHGPTMPRLTALEYAFFYELDSASNLRYGLLLILAFSSLTAYSIILAG